MKPMEYIWIERPVSLSFNCRHSSGSLWVRKRFVSDQQLCYPWRGNLFCPLTKIQDLMSIAYATI